MEHKKQNFLQGAAMLAAATVLVKVIGALYKIPLKLAIGDQGYSYFITAYDIYSVLLMISTAGLPVAMSRMISQATALGHYNRVRRIYETCRTIFLIIGIASTLLMMVLCRQLAELLNQPDAWAAILFLGPCALLMGVLSTYRGFFQGQGNMAPTSVSQVLEAVFKLVVGLAAAYAVLRYTQSVPLAAGGAILGVTVSCLVSAIYLRRKLVPAYRALPRTSEAVEGYGATAKQVLSIAIPITIGAAGLQLLTVVESGLYMGQLLDIIGGGLYMKEMVSPQMDAQAVADTLKGIYNMTQTIFNMPCAFMIPITTSVLPAITSYITLSDHKAVKATEESAARIAGLLALPCTVGLILLAEPVMALLGGYSGVRLELAGQLMQILGLCVFLYAIIQYTNVVLQSHGYAHVPVINMLVCGVVKLIVVYVLVGNPQVGILGAPIGAALCYFFIGALNLIAISRLVPQKPRILTNMLRSFIPAAVMGVAVWGTTYVLTQVLSISSRVLLCGVPVAVGGLVYAVCVVFFRGITREDCLLLPKGEKLARFFK